MAQHGDPAFAHQQAIGQLVGKVVQQASVITYSETFFVLAMAMLFCIPLAFILRKQVQPGSTPPPAAH